MKTLHKMVVQYGHYVIVLQNGLGNPRFGVGVLDEPHLDRVEYAKGLRLVVQCPVQGYVLLGQYSQELMGKRRS